MVQSSIFTELLLLFNRILFENTSKLASTRVLNKVFSKKKLNNKKLDMNMKFTSSDTCRILLQFSYPACLLQPVDSQ